MLYAIINKELISANEFAARFGRAHLDGRVVALCPSCQRKVDPYGLHSPHVTNRFDHPNGVKDCPLSSANDERYRYLKPSTRDAKQGRQLRKAFLRDGSLRPAYAFAFKVCGRGNLPAAKYGELIIIADGLGIWEYANLPKWTVPFILLTLADFKAKNHDFSFQVLKPRAALAEDLWLSPEECQLEKIFSDGKPMKKAGKLNNPIPIIEEIYREAASDCEWVSDKVLRAIRRKCS